ncbi:MAG: WbqC family protein [Phocaeicola sp.]|uniref:WbqC family protein n=1 Tax=Phocaeicola sp. TaxID=2773926 RepID=UPI003F9F4E60
MMKTVYLSSAYLAPVEYYTKLYYADKVYVERFDHYMKQTYRNRCIIASPEGPLSLSIPTEKSTQTKILMKEVRVSDHGNWRHLHWNALETAYGNSPFFEYYADDFRPFYEKKHKYLYDYNKALCELICRLIDIDPEIEETDEYKMNFADDEEDYRSIIHPKVNYEKMDKSFHPLPYYQVFKEKFGFLPNLSIVDLLFNMGPESLFILRGSYK